MAQQIQTLFIDDIDGGAAEGTVRFGLDGTEYEIDLNAKHAEELRKVLADYAAHARKVGGTTRRAPRGHRTGADAIDTAKVREWAKESGYDIRDRGRVPATVVEKYKAAVGA
jgi:Lsr2